MNVLFVWTGLTGYMGDAWRALARESGIRLKVVIQAQRQETARFDASVTLRELDYTLLDEDESADTTQLGEQIQRFAPDVMYIVGWRRTLPRYVATASFLEEVPKVLIFDLPFKWSVKKMIAPVVLRLYLRRFCGCFVPGARAARYARWLGFKENGLGWVETGLFCANVRKFDGVWQRRRGMTSYPRRFLFTGRYVREKGLDVLVSAYKRYRELAGHQPWELTCCGMGPLGKLFKGVEGIRDAGFVQPDDLPRIFQEHGAFVITSSHEPWGVVIAEAAAAGLPIVCTEACGAALDVVSGNGAICKVGDCEGIAHAMLAIDLMETESRKEMGRKGLALALQFSCERWVSHVASMTKNIVDRRRLQQKKAENNEKYVP